MRKTALALLFILMFLFSAAPILQFVSLVSANAVPYPALPNQDPPTLAVQTPQDGETFTASTIEVKFTVTKPNSWLLNNRTLYYWPRRPIVGTFHVHLYLDGELLNPDGIFDPRVESLTTSHSMVLKNLTRDEHSVKIDLMATMFYKNSGSDPYERDYLENFMNVSDTLHFTINTEQSLPSPELASSPEPQQTEPFPSALVVAFVASVVIVIGLVVYFSHAKRERRSRA